MHRISTVQQGMKRKEPLSRAVSTGSMKHMSRPERSREKNGVLQTDDCFKWRDGVIV